MRIELSDPFSDGSTLDALFFPKEEKDAALKEARTLGPEWPYFVQSYGTRRGYYIPLNVGAEALIQHGWADKFSIRIK